jgi:mannitol/fructose-specific phosphotransferase system IIA component (Ntr-type)
MAEQNDRGVPEGEQDMKLAEYVAGDQRDENKVGFRRPRDVVGPGPEGKPDGVAGLSGRVVEELDFLITDASLADRTTSRDGLLREMVTRISAAGLLPLENCQQVLEALVKREQLGSTGIGRGIAIPHTKHPAVSRTVGIVAGSRAGIDFESVDDQPVHLVVLLISPPGETREHLRALERTSKVLLQLISDAGDVDRSGSIRDDVA